MTRRFRESRDPEGVLTRVEAALPSLCDRSQTPGAAVTILSQDSSVTAVAGHARLPATRITAKTVFALSSITKVFTATLIAGLVQQGRLSYDDLVIDHLPDFSLAGGEGRGITVRHLVTHTGGFEGPEGATAGHSGTSAAAFVRSLQAFTPYAPPGALFGYSSAGYVVLAAIVERILGISYLEALRREVLAPLRLDAGDAAHFPEDQIAVGHAVRGRTVETPIPVYPPALDAAGGLWATSHTVASFGHSFIDGDAGPAATPFDAGVPADVLQPVVARPEGSVEQLAQGLIWRHATWDGEPILWHTGGSPGHACKLTVLPRRRLSIATMTNAQLGIGHQVTGPLEAWLLYHLAGIEQPDPPPPSPPALLLTAYAGSYERHTRTLHISADGDQLRLASVPTAHADPQLRRIDTRLTAVGQHLFRDETGHTYHFATLDGDRPTHVASRGWVARRVPA